MTGLTSSRAREFLAYDPSTGVIVWRVNRRRVRAGDVADSVDSDGYKIVGIEGKNYRAHRVAFLIMQGRWPYGQIDHIDGNRSNNRWTNLREVSHQKNGCNQRFRCTNKSGHMGVCWNRRACKWQAQITVNNRSVYLGCFADKNEAIAARKSAERHYGFHKNHGRAA